MDCSNFVELRSEGFNRKAMRVEIAYNQSIPVCYENPTAEDRPSPCRRWHEMMHHQELAGPGRTTHVILLSVFRLAAESLGAHQARRRTSKLQPPNSSASRRQQLHPRQLTSSHIHDAGTSLRTLDTITRSHIASLSARRRLP